MKRFFFYALYAANAAVIIGFWWTGNGSTAWHALGPSLMTLGDLCGLLGAQALVWQLILISRITPLEQTFGLPFITKLHRWNGYLAVTVLLTHPTLLTFGYTLTYHTDLWGQFWSFILTFEHVWWAAIALLLILTMVALSISIVRRRLKYETWYYVHLSSYVAILLAFSHQLSVGTDFIGRPAFITYWYLLYIVGAGAILSFRFGLPTLRLAYHRFRVAKVVPEGKDTTSIYIEGRHLDQFKVVSGQFAIWRFWSPPFWWQAHPFSFSKEPDGRYLRLTVKSLGDFTSLLPHLKPGTPVLIDGPHGIFDTRLRQGKRVLLVAGGIGITPLRAMLDPLLRDGCDVSLVYAARTISDFSFRNELSSLLKRYDNFKLHYVTSAEQTPGMRFGIVDQEMLKTLVPDTAKCEAYVCGPPPMMDAVTEALVELGIPRQKVYTERFAF